MISTAAARSTSQYIKIRRPLQAYYSVLTQMSSSSSPTKTTANKSNNRSRPRGQDSPQSHNKSASSASNNKTGHHHTLSQESTPNRPSKRQNRNMSLSQRKLVAAGNENVDDVDLDELDGPITLLDGKSFVSLEEYIERVEIDDRGDPGEGSSPTRRVKPWNRPSLMEKQVQEVDQGTNNKGRDLSNNSDRGLSNSSDRGISNKKDRKLADNKNKDQNQSHNDQERKLQNHKQHTDSDPQIDDQNTSHFQSNAHIMLQKGIEWLTNAKTIFISLDLEWWERDSKKLTEVGLAIYDPSVQGPVGLRVPNIHYEHLIVKEHIKNCNGRFVSDHKFHCSFVERSKQMTLANCRKTYLSILKHYERRAARMGFNVVYVGHNVGGDISVLEREGFYTGNYPILDTMTAWSANPSANFFALHKILKYLGLAHGLLHNATNDAHYTLMLALCICDPQYREWKKLDEPLKNTEQCRAAKETPGKSSINCSNPIQAMSMFLSAQGM